MTELVNKFTTEIKESTEERITALPKLGLGKERYKKLPYEAGAS